MRHICAIVPRMSDTYQLFALPARNRTTLLAFASKQFLLFVLDHNLVFAKWTLLEVFQPCSLELLSLADSLIEIEQFGTQYPTELRRGEKELAPGLVHALDGRVLFAKTRRRV